MTFFLKPVFFSIDRSIDHQPIFRSHQLKMGLGKLFNYIDKYYGVIKKKSGGEVI